MTLKAASAASLKCIALAWVIVGCSYFLGRLDRTAVYSIMGLVIVVAVYVGLWNVGQELERSTWGEAPRRRGDGDG
jgi:ABC-type uncharacterized transport system permease subunit